MRFFSGLLLLLFLSASSAEAGKFLEKCPCGPDSIRGPFRLLLMQGHKGADFRDSCRKHDACYDTLGSLQKDCDDRFLINLLSSCKDSRQPRRCERKGRFAYWLVSRLGGNAYRSAQKLAAEKGK